MLDDILSQVQKPGRYIGQEWNVSVKDFQGAGVKFALCFPDLYELGMSNLGLRIIYGILNNIPDVVCERFFAVATDMENILRDKKLEIFSLESKRGLREFDIIGFSLGYELAYTNVLAMLELGMIPFKSSLRDKNHPLIIGGGPCALNAEPMHEFFDLFVIGEAEEVILEIIDAYRKLKSKFKEGKINKDELLAVLANIEGVYVPSAYEVAYNAQGKIEGFKPRIKGVPLPVKKRFIKNLDKTFFPSEWLVPYIQTIYDRIVLEIMRGCPNRCRFCQAKQQYYPFRKRQMESVLNLASVAYQNSGYEEISLGGLSVSDYPSIVELIRGLIGMFKDKAVSVSLPSIKPKTLFCNLPSLIATVKKTGFTFAPEAATERLRQILGKDFDMDDFLESLKQAYLAGYQHIKLYFMIGIPTETKVDLDAIVNFANQVLNISRQVNPAPARKGWVNISINTLIPRPHTPFQWLGMENMASIISKQNYLKNKISRNQKLKLNFHKPQMSFLEAVLSRGDRRLSQVILYAFLKGARFDAWEDKFNFSIWEDAFREFEIEPTFYLQEKSKDELLPWDLLEISSDKETLWSEFNKAVAI